MNSDDAGPAEFHLSGTCGGCRTEINGHDHCPSHSFVSGWQKPGPQETLTRSPFVEDNSVGLSSSLRTFIASKVDSYQREVPGKQIRCRRTLAGPSLRNIGLDAVNSLFLPSNKLPAFVMDVTSPNLCEGVNTKLPSASGTKIARSIRCGHSLKGTENSRKASTTIEVALTLERT